MMALEPHGTDVWVGTGPSYPWGGLYGGQIVAQALRAATFTVDPAFRVHSLHAYFIRSGDSREPIRFEVERVRNGRSFCTRRTTARQSVGVILELTASYQIDEDAPQVQTAVMPSIGGPDDLEAAATVDGTSRLGALFRVIMPLSAPGMVTAAIIVFVNSWNEFLLALTFNTAVEMRTVPVGITFYQGQFSFPWAVISAAVTLGVIPLVLLIIFFQQRIISGLTAGGVKG